MCGRPRVSGSRCTAQQYGPFGRSYSDLLVLRGCRWTPRAGRTEPLEVRSLTLLVRLVAMDPAGRLYWPFVP